MRCPCCGARAHGPPCGAPVFRRRRFFTGEIAANGLPDVAWLSAGGKAMSEEDWTAANVDPLAVFLNGHGIAEPGARGEAIEDDSFLILFNPTAEEAAVTLPDATYGERWSVVLDTGDAPTAGKREAGSPHAVGARSLVLLTHG